MIVKTDKNLLINVETIIDRNHYLTIAYDLGKNELGFAEFNKRTDDELWLYQIKTYPENRNLGIGSALLEFVEFWAAKFDCNHVAAKYGPTSDYVKEFYYKNNYEFIEREYYTRLEKPVDKESTINKMIQKHKQEPTVFVDKKNETINETKEKDKKEPTTTNNKRDEIQKLVEENIIKQEYDYTSFKAE